MSDTISIRGNNYKIEAFSDVHLSTIMKLIEDLGNLEHQSSAGFVLKEIILPTLPEDIIRTTTKDKYIILLNAAEISEVLTHIMISYYRREIPKAEKEGKTKYAEQLKANLTELQLELTIQEEKPQNSAEELEQLKAELAQLKAEKSNQIKSAIS